MNPLKLLAGIALLLAGCDDKEEDPTETPSVVGQPAEDAAEVTTQSVCSFAARCGRISIACADCEEPEGCPGCQVELHTVDYDACVADQGEDFATGFACEALSATDEARVDECLAALPDLACPTVEDAQTWADGGPPGEDPRKGPPACELVDDIRYRCFDHSDPGGDPGEPIPE